MKAFARDYCAALALMALLFCVTLAADDMLTRWLR